MIPRFVELFNPDFFLVAGRYTLMEQDIVADELPMLVERGIGVVIGAVFGSGLLATGPVAGARYSYRSPTSDEIDKVTRIRSVCDRHGVPLVAAALQFPLGHPAVASVIPGPNSPEQVQSNLEGIHYPVPADLWRELQHERLLRQDAPVPAGEVAVAH
jgi:D-threo-aldose 1-dehydrogenase